MSKMKKIINFSVHILNVSFNRFGPKTGVEEHENILFLNDCFNTFGPKPGSKMKKIMGF